MAFHTVNTFVAHSEALIRRGSHLRGTCERALSASSSKPPTNCSVVRGPSLLRTTVHRPSPSLLVLPGLRSLPFWTQWDGSTNRIAYQDPAVTQAVQLLEQNYKTILAEYQNKAPQLQSDYQTDTEHKLHDGTWEWHSYMLKGAIQGHFAAHFPETASILQDLRTDGLLFEGTPFGYCFFSTLHANSKIAAHTAPMNLRLRIHLPLIVPSEDESDEIQCGIRVGPIARQWTTGKALVLDDAYQHEVWNKTNQQRVLLLVDIWHPDVTVQERQDVVELFQHAHEQGWWSS